jgi:DUF4097 and DUF4098 domain-containing protein YvlB
MKRALSFLAAILLVGWVAAIPAAASVQGTFQRTFQVSGPVNLEVLTHSGDVTVRGGPAGTVSITGKIHVGSHWLGGDRNSDVQELERNPPLHQEGNSIRVEYTNYRNIAIDYEITAPLETTVRTRSGSGDVTLESLRGNMDLQSGSGDFRLRDLTGELRLETGSGDMKAERIAGPVNAHAGSGNIKVEETATGDVSARTGSGNIELRGVKGGLRAESGSGDQRVEGTPTASWNLRTGSGNIELRLSSDVGFDLDVSTNSGTVVLDKPVVTTVEGRVQEQRHHIAGQVKGGGPAVSVRTGSGDVHIY